MKIGGLRMQSWNQSARIIGFDFWSYWLRIVRLLISLASSLYPTNRKVYCLLLSKWSLIVTTCSVQDILLPAIGQCSKQKAWETSFRKLHMQPLSPTLQGPWKNLNKFPMMHMNGSPHLINLPGISQNHISILIWSVTCCWIICASLSRVPYWNIGINQFWQC